MYFFLFIYVVAMNGSLTALSVDIECRLLDNAFLRDIRLPDCIT